MAQNSQILGFEISNCNIYYKINDKKLPNGENVARRKEQQTLFRITEIENTKDTKTKRNTSKTIKLYEIH